MTLHRYATFAGILLVLVIAVGASVTTLAEFASLQQAQVDSLQSIATLPAHAVAGIFGALLVLGLVPWVFFSRQPKAVAFAVWASAAIAVAEAATGILDRTSASVPVAALHACFAPLILSLMTLIAALTSLHGSGPGELVLLRSGGTIRQAAFAGPPLALLQIVFGALYRHKVIGVLLHMAGALAVSLLTLIVCVAIIQQITPSMPVKTAASAAMTVVLTQITLGIAAFVMRLLNADAGPIFLAVTVLHVTVGSMTLASTTLLAFNTRSVHSEGNQKIALGESQ
jgi:hypothetical protein